MKPAFKLPLLLLAAIFLTSCSSMLPVNSYFEKAGTLQKGATEISGHATGYSVSHFERTDKVSGNYGFRVGHGVTDRLDMKFRYENQTYTSNFDNRLKSVQYVSFVPKFAVEQGKLAVALPISTYFTKYEIEGTTYKETYASITPWVIYTATTRSNKADLSLGMKYDLIFGGEGNTFFGGFLGAGFSSNLDKWAIRPEVGVSLSDRKVTYWNYGIGLQFILSKRK